MLDVISTEAKRNGDLSEAKAFALANKSSTNENKRIKSRNKL